MENNVECFQEVLVWMFQAAFTYPVFSWIEFLVGEGEDKAAAPVRGLNQPVWLRRAPSKPALVRLAGDLTRTRELKWTVSVSGRVAAFSCTCTVSG